MAATDIEFPANWDVNNGHLVHSNDPEKIYREYDHLRSTCPVAHVDAHGGYWILTKYTDIKATASDNSKFISAKCAVVPADPRGIRRPPLKFDGEQHAPYRTAVDRTLKPARLRRLEPILRSHAERELGRLIQQGHGDIYEEFGAQFSGWVEKEWLNLDEPDSKLLSSAITPFVTAWRTQNWALVKSSSDMFYEIARRVIASRKDQLLDPEEDPASSLLIERDHDGNPLDDHNLVGCIRQILIVAMVAPSIIISSMTNHLSRDKELQNRLRNDRKLVPAAIEEFIRLYVPYRGFSRTALHEVEISGTKVPPDEPITVVYAAANRDPDQFPRPDEFIMHRDNISTHLGFGHGRHRCAGMVLARMMLRIYLETLLDNTVDFEIEGEIHYARLPEIGLTTCPMRFYPRP
ncbi:cytochrome P450 [Aspergillus sergii]|uniref:Cytochrome P450 n=1 Tax=Aspergillus sergii TaxID=1034303 RepID=A0A5N6X3I0_9EURO|nr:cytochrome P450 [Aspergillus sergii]